MVGNRIIIITTVEQHATLQVIDADEDCNLNPAFHTKHCTSIINKLEVILASH